ncbi:hypothetical protein QBC35DRAFT_447983 [Podospora australis]|uniref:Uncharacterized protein n=1 Tax=Podospora australis TaxID=1536484 RepID=A0AAN6X1V6_9PEZI|nr:hypothetical protein QBC35DRAFT_447983 [Podospora australis]
MYLLLVLVYILVNGGGDDGVLAAPVGVSWARSGRARHDDGQDWRPEPVIAPAEIPYGTRPYRADEVIVPFGPGFGRKDLGPWKPWEPKAQYDNQNPKPESRLLIDHPSQEGEDGIKSRLWRPEEIMPVQPKQKIYLQAAAADSATNTVIIQALPPTAIATVTVTIPPSATATAAGPITTTMVITIPSAGVAAPTAGGGGGGGGANGSAIAAPASTLTLTAFNITSPSPSTAIPLAPVPPPPAAPVDSTVTVVAAPSTLTLTPWVLTLTTPVPAVNVPTATVIPIVAASSVQGETVTLVDTATFVTTDAANGAVVTSLAQVTSLVVIPDKVTETSAQAVVPTLTVTATPVPAVAATTIITAAPFASAGRASDGALIVSDAAGVVSTLEGAWTTISTSGGQWTSTLTVTGEFGA